MQNKNRRHSTVLECLRIFTRIILELEYDVNSNLFQIRKLCLRFLIYVMLENFRIDNQHGLCAEKCQRAGRNFIRLMMFMLEHCNHQCSSQSKTVKLKLKLKVLFKTKLIGRNLIYEARAFKARGSQCYFFFTLRLERSRLEPQSKTYFIIQTLRLERSLKSQSVIIIITLRL